MESKGNEGLVKGSDKRRRCCAGSIVSMNFVTSILLPDTGFSARASPIFHLDGIDRPCYGIRWIRWIRVVVVVGVSLP